VAVPLPAPFHLGALLGPYFLGERADDIANVRQRIREMGYLGWRCGWIEAACWDLVGKARGRPVYELLGGDGGRIETYASSGEVRSGAARAAEIEARLAEGFEAVKLRVHDDTLAEDCKQIREARAAVGAAPVLGVDANQGWRVAAIADAPAWDYDRALAFCREAEEQGFTWVEEPLPMDDYAGLARLRAASEVAIAGGELNSQGYQPDAVFAGGVAESWAIARHVAAAGALYSPHTWTNGIGFAINMQLFAASPSRGAVRFEYPYDPPGWVPEGRDGLLVEPWLHRDGDRPPGPAPARQALLHRHQAAGRRRSRVGPWAVGGQTAGPRAGAAADLAGPPVTREWGRPGAGSSSCPRTFLDRLESQKPRR
jgi:L-alanine-DL-glutamate epimerase-like enolase superfamily enzyme